jgi:hypothetical protein
MEEKKDVSCSGLWSYSTSEVFAAEEPSDNPDWRESKVQLHWRRAGPRISILDGIEMESLLGLKYVAT